MGNNCAVRAWGRTELAQAYFPDLGGVSAWRKLRGWIALCAPLAAELARLGYDGRRRSFTPREVAAIFYFIGEP